MRHDSNTSETIRQIKEEIEKLKQEQEEAMTLAVYVGMMQEQTKHYDARLDRIKDLIERLTRLIKPE